MDEDLITDITLDHLPDLSDASVSFQIPALTASTDLLVDQTGGFDLLCNDDEPSFAPVSFRDPRGPSLTLAELTPRVQPTLERQSRSPTPTPGSSANSAVNSPPLSLGHCSPCEPRHTLSIDRLLQSPFVSEERLDQLRADVETLGQTENEPMHVQPHVVPPLQHGVVQRPPSPPNSEFGNDAQDNPPPSEDPPSEVKDTHLGHPLANYDVVMAPTDDSAADATHITVPGRKPNRNPRTTGKSTVAAGGISKRRPFPTTRVSKKTKSKPSRAQEAHNVLPRAPRQPTPPQSIAFDTVQELVPPACSSGDTDIKAKNTQITHPGTGGMAERLVSYSQRLISSIGLYKPWPEGSSSEACNDAVKVADESRTTAIVLASSPSQCTHHTPSARHEPLRLSEISPHKPPANAPQSNSPAHTGTLQEGIHAVSPMRPAKKRLKVDADLPQGENLRRKRGKIVPADAESERGSADEAVSQAQPHSNAQRHENLDGSNAMLPCARTKYTPRLNFSAQCKGPTLDAFPYLSRSRRVGTGETHLSETRRSASSFLRRDKRTSQGNVRCHARHRSGPTSAGDLPLIEKKQGATLSLTKPVGFTFRVDARLEARKMEERLTVSEPGKTHAVPECKALRASHQPASATVPSVPVPFFFCTEQRAKERDRFDAMMKHKEEEMERLKEAQRRREAEEEALAIKALRRRAIPKANQIPEWYADMPKRRDTAV